MNKAVWLVPAFALTLACSGSYNAVNMVTGNQVFVGETEDNIGSMGSFILEAPNGVTCSGEYAFKTELTGKGTLNCSDKREGNFVFSSETKDGRDYTVIKGYGRFTDGTKFSITFGEAAPRNLPQPQESAMPQQYTGQSGQPYTGQIDIPLH